MKEYPSIPAAADLLARPDDHLGRPFAAFDKLDGSNIRAEWDRKKGWRRFGSRRLLDASQPLLGQAVRLILDGYGDGLAKAFIDDPALRRPQEATAYFEFIGPHSFAGLHDPADLGVPANEPFRVVLIDVNLHKRGFVSADQFIERFGRLGIPRVVHRGVLDRQFIADVRAGRFGDGEGVVDLRPEGGDGPDLAGMVVAGLGPEAGADAEDQVAAVGPGVPLQHVPDPRLEQRLGREVMGLVQSGLMPTAVGPGLDQADQDDVLRAEQGLHQEAVLFGNAWPRLLAKVVGNQRRCTVHRESPFSGEPGPR